MTPYSKPFGNAKDRNGTTKEPNATIQQAIKAPKKVKMAPQAQKNQASPYNKPYGIAEKRDGAI